jgi:hypothetical protein
MSKIIRNKKIEASRPMHWYSTLSIMGVLFLIICALGVVQFLQLQHDTDQGDVAPVQEPVFTEEELDTAIEYFKEKERRFNETQESFKKI